jgi:hypothetical protein
MFNISELLCIKEAVKTKLDTWIEDHGKAEIEVISEMDCIVRKIINSEIDFNNEFKALGALRERHHDEQD